MKFYWEVTEEEFKEEFARKLKYYMEKYNYNQYELSDLSGVSQAAISNYLNARQMVTMRSVYNFCKVFNITIEDLMPYGKDRVRII